MWKDVGVDDASARQLLRAHARVLAAEAARVDRDALVAGLIETRVATRSEVARMLGVSYEAVRKMELRGRGGGS